MAVEVFTPARSSFINELEYDPDADELTIEFNDGTRWKYSGITPATYRNMCLAPSIGGFFHRHIKDAYAYEEA